MAANMIYLRPSADISVGHELYPTDSTSAYSLINEEEQDGSTTYISVSAPAATDENTPGTATATSSFELSGVLPTGNFRISSGRVVCYKTSLSSSGITNVTITMNGVSFIVGDIWSSENAVILPDEIINTINNYISNNGADIFSNMSIILTTTIRNFSTKLGDTCGLTQVYLELTTNILVYRKINNDWKDGFGAYKKINGVWTEIENGYDTVRSKLHRMGHHQEYVPPVAPTCTETGLTKGYKCVICGEFIRPQEVVPANGHNYIKSGGYNVCDVCGHVEGLGFAELVYHGTATTLSQTRGDLAATTVGNYALFGGGDIYIDSSLAYLSTVDAYDISLTRSIPTELSTKRGNLAATTVGNYALFGGGGYTGSNKYSTVDAYDISLTRSIPTELSTKRDNLAATTVGNYALFGGGYSGGSAGYLTTVDAYDISLTRSIPTELSTKRGNLAATTVGNYALFGGGDSGSSRSTTVDAYDISLTRSLPTELSTKRGNLAATTVGNYALFGGGDSGTSSYYPTVDAYDISLTRSILTELSTKRSDLAAITIGNYALFGGGSYTDSLLTDLSTVDAYDILLTRSILTELSTKRSGLAATTVGNYALFGGGDSGGISSYYSTVDAYKLQPISG